MLAKIRETIRKVGLDLVAKRKLVEEDDEHTFKVVNV